MKSTHRTQAGHDKDLYSCETWPRWEGVSSICLFICLFDSPQHSARGTGGPTKVRCQRGVYKIEQSRTCVSERETGENWSKREWRRERERHRAGSVGGWVGGFGNAEWTSCVLLLVKQRYDFCNGSTHSLSSISCKHFALWGVEETPNQFKSNMLWCAPVLPALLCWKKTDRR